jgi:hypothetical protein
VRAWLAVAACWALLFALCLTLAHVRGAFASELAAYDDEPSHVVNGLLVHDWLVGGASQHPMRFAERYYLHYPKVAIGQWPPLFYAFEAGWFLLFGASIAACVALMAAWCAAVGALVFAFARARLGTGAALAAALVTVLVPELQRLGTSVMTEVPMALWCTAAALCFGKWLADGRARFVLAFAVLSSCAILTKGSGIALAAVPPLAIAFDRRWARLASPSLWLAGLLVAFACAPWYVLTVGRTSETWGLGTSPNATFFGFAIEYYPARLVALAGVVVAALAAFGFVARLRSAEGRSAWAALGALLVALLLVYLTIPTSLETRHLVLLVPPLVLFAFAGAFEVARLAARGRAHRLGHARLACCGVLCLGFALEAGRLPPKDVRGHRAVVEELLRDTSLERSILMIASDPIGEGAFVVDVALGERRQGPVVLRASKGVGRADWLGQGYEPVFADAAELEAWHERIPVGIVVIDRSMRGGTWFPHHDRLVEVFTGSAAWELAFRHDVVRDGVTTPAGLEVWRQRGHEGRPVQALDVHSMLRGAWGPADSR